VKVVFIDEALRDLDQIFEFNQGHYPASADAFRRRLRAIEQRITRWPESAPEAKQRLGVRVAFLTPRRRAVNHGIVRKPEKLRQTADGNLRGANL
jgi:plasmid stabilization system protein ParE